MKGIATKFLLIGFTSLTLSACGPGSFHSKDAPGDAPVTSEEARPADFRKNPIEPPTEKKDVRPKTADEKLEEIHDKREEQQTRAAKIPEPNYLNNSPYWVKYPWMKITEGDKWAAFIQKYLKEKTPELLKVVPKDAARFCMNYVNLNPEQRLTFWTRWISVLAELESTYKPTTVVKDIQVGPGIYSAGLLQISFRSVSESNYGCETIKEAKDLLDPEKNLACGMRIMKKFIVKDGYFAHYDEKDPKSSWRGGSRYWAPLRSSRLKTPAAREQLEDYVLQRREAWAKEGRSQNHPALQDEAHRKNKESAFEKFLRLINMTPLCNPIPIRNS
jgi:hypothetical protein